MRKQVLIATFLSVAFSCSAFASDASEEGFTVAAADAMSEHGGKKDDKGAKKKAPKTKKLKKNKNHGKKGKANAKKKSVRGGGVSAASGGNSVPASSDPVPPAAPVVDTASVPAADLRTDTDPEHATWQYVCPDQYLTDIWARYGNTSPQIGWLPRDWDVYERAATNNRTTTRFDRKFLSALPAVKESGNLENNGGLVKGATCTTPGLKARAVLGYVNDSVLLDDECKKLSTTKKPLVSLCVLGHPLNYGIGHFMNSQARDAGVVDKLSRNVLIKTNSGECEGNFYTTCVEPAKDVPENVEVFGDITTVDFK